MKFGGNKYNGNDQKQTRKIHMFTRGRDFGVPEYLAEKGLDVNVEYVRNGMNDEMLAIEVFETQEIAREKDDDKNKDIDVDRISRLMRGKLQNAIKY